MALSRKQLLIGGGVVAAGLGAYYLFRKPTIEYYDNIWCNDGCQNIIDEFGSYQGYVQAMQEIGADQGRASAQQRESDGTGNVNLLFLKPHNLSIGDEIYLKQDPNTKVYEYDGFVSVRRVINENIVSLNIARQGSSPVVSGEVIKPSIWSGISPF